MSSPAGKRRRKIIFRHLGEVLPEVRRLAPGCETVSRWSLGQICAHLAASFDGSMDGFHYSRHRTKRFLIAKPMLWYTYLFGIPEQYQVDPGIEPHEEVPVDVGVDRLTRAITRYEAFSGRLMPHPLFGRMSRSQWDRVHGIHCAHHLSFVRPAGGIY